ncbi:hypothetical protein CORC01_04467 [Colletotrichum orchidophilum]|uniref:LysM domain-containing protein n=1 Tax=Colletotrichum orchidophilum TaxID=1209926 RepID=A0A1G4BG00_9PEZI|nr:uncharacterized protein CORC01_04467 [Colletotrichum orchidophilum]OHF00278.1 hypothetical protein CORC01_04467 [Colletotrichum orchidophilum]
MKFITAIATIVLVSTSVVALPAEPIATPNPHIEPMWSKCTKFYQATRGETCASLASKNNLTVADIMGLNRGIGGQRGCQMGNIIEAYWYCVKPEGW